MDLSLYHVEREMNAFVVIFWKRFLSIGSRGMIPASGAGGPGFNPWSGPFDP
jgi:hypothetical protein